jgi:NADPH:quinone reductase-like Zn-dependent oxidoreductase
VATADGEQPVQRDRTPKRGVWQGGILCHQTPQAGRIAPGVRSFRDMKAVSTKVVSKLRRYGLAAISCAVAVVVARPLDAPSSCFFLVPYITAWASVVSAAQIQPGETILIVGAAGAVGQAATQTANWKQARVIGAAITSDPISDTVSVINTKTEDLREKLLELTAGKGTDAVFDTVVGPMFELALRSLGFGGRQVAISSRGEPTCPTTAGKPSRNCLRRC